MTVLLPFILAAAINLGPVQLFTGKDFLPPPAFSLRGHDSTDQDDTSVLPIPYVGKNSDGDMELSIVYKSPIAGECGVFTTEDPYASLDHALLRGAFPTKAGQMHHSVGVLTSFGEDPSKFILFVICLPLDVKTPAEAKAEAKFSGRYIISTFPTETT